MAALYVVFSRTKCKMGSFIRTMTHGFYNHVSVALDPRLDEVYSFSRFKHKTPFCAGFVREGAERYRIENHIAEIAVCAVEVDAAHMEAVKTRLADMMAGRDRYVYNMLSAACVPLRHTVRIRDSYTCIEFALSILRTACYPLGDRYYSITDLYDELSPCCVYRGEYPETAAVTDITYNDNVPVRSRFTRSARQIWRMTYRFVRH